jgi:hypothetical protein
MNDHQEFRYALTIARSVAFLMLRNSEERFRTKFTAILEQQLNQVAQVGVYAMCFSEAPDLLSQWRGYASGGGYNLGFSLEALEKVAAKEKLAVAEVLYRFEDHRRLLEPILTPLIHHFDPAWEADKDLEQIKTFFRPAIRAIAKESPRIKHETLQRSGNGGFILRRLPITRKRKTSFSATIELYQF